MICCKITIDLHETGSENAKKLLENLAAIGDCLVINGSFYFAELQDPSFDKPRLARLIKRCGVKNFLLSVYTKENSPDEGDTVNIWLANRLLKMNYKLYEMHSQKAFREISSALDVLDAEIEALAKIKNDEEGGEAES